MVPPENRNIITSVRLVFLFTDPLCVLADCSSLPLGKHWIHEVLNVSYSHMTCEDRLAVVVNWNPSPLGTCLSVTLLVRLPSVYLSDHLSVSLLVRLLSIYLSDNLSVSLLVCAPV